MDNKGGAMKITQIILRAVSLGKVQQMGLQYIPSYGAFAKPGDVFVAPADGNPIVITSTLRDTFVVHATNLDIIDVIVGGFKRKVRTLDDITMCIQVTSAAIESEYVERARRAGLRYVWSMNSVDEFLTRERVPLGQMVHVMLKHGF